MKNTGKPTEKLFEDSITALGKDGYFYRIKDAAAIRGLTGSIGRAVDATPSDYVVCMLGETFFCEVKSTQHETLFEFSLLKKGQNAHSSRIIAAKGGYRVVIHRLSTDQWYIIPMSVILHHTVITQRKSFTWEELESYRWHSLVATPKGSRPKWSPNVP